MEMANIAVLGHGVVGSVVLEVLTSHAASIAKRAKELGYDAIHDTVHEMAKDEARHGKAFEGLLNRYFG